MSTNPLATLATTALAFVVLLAAPGAASAESLCTDTWIGPAEGNWGISSDWSSGKEPTSADVACVGAGHTVKIEEIHHVTGVLQGEGALLMTGGTLELANALAPSRIKTVSIVGGTFTGPAEVEVYGSFYAGGFSPWLTGTGTIRLESGTSNTITNGPDVELEKRTIVNEGSLTIQASAGIAGREGSAIVNYGTFTINGEKESSKGLAVETGGASLENLGTIRKSEGAGTAHIAFTFDNESKVIAEAGVLDFTGGGTSSKEKVASWAASTGAKVMFGAGSFALGSTVPLSGAIEVFTANVTAGTVEGSTANLTVYYEGCCSHGKLEINGTTPSTLASLTLAGTLTGTGEIDITNSFSNVGGISGTNMTGTGKTVLAPGSTSTIYNAPDLNLAKRTFVNEGTLTIQTGAGIDGKEGATLINHGTLRINGDKESTDGLFAEGGGATPALVNTGTVLKSEGTGTTHIGFTVDNESSVIAESGTLDFVGGGTSATEKTGSWAASAGAKVEFGSGTFALGSTVPLSGSIEVFTATVTAGTVEGSGANLTVYYEGCCSHGKVEINGASPSTLASLTLAGTLTGTGEVDITNSFSNVGGISGTYMTGAGRTVLERGSTSTIYNAPLVNLAKRTLVNEGTLTIQTGAGIDGKEGATLINHGTLTINGEKESTDGLFVETPGPTPRLVNTGTVQKTEGVGTTYIRFGFENYGVIEAHTGKFAITEPLVTASPETQFGALNPSALAALRASCGDPVDCVTGNDTETQTDISVGGRGVGLDLQRSYNAQAAAKATSAGAFGYGWTSSFSDHLVVESANHKATLYQANGSTVPFTEASGTFSAPSWSGDTLSGSAEAGYTVTLADQTKYVFSGSSGRLEGVEDRNGNKTTLSYNEKGQLTTIADPAGRQIKLTYDAEGQVESAEDPMGHLVKYTYEGGNLASVTLPGETSPNWRFKYDASHRLTLMIDGRGGETMNTYDSSSRVISQKDPLGHVLKFEYEAFQTKITNEATGAVTLDQYNSNDMVTATTHGYGTAVATTSKIAYNEANEPTSMTDGNGHATTYEYDGAGNKIKMVDPESRETKWTYNGTHDVMRVTRPNGEKTTIARDEHGNPTVSSRPAPGETTQEVKFEYNTHGEPTSMTDPLGHKWSYEYDTQGDKTSETDPEGDKKTFGYNEDSQLTSIVSPRGNVEGGEPAKYTTTIERDARGRKIKVTDPRGKETRYSYDPNSNLTVEVDANSHETKIAYDADNHPTKVTKPNGAVSETGYDGAGAVTSQTDGNLHTTKYVRNVLEQVTEVVDPLLRKTTKTYDAAGNLETVKDPAGRTTTYTYDKANELTKVSYSDGVTPTVEYEYDKDGNRTVMIDGTGKTIYSYDQLDRLTKVTDGHGSTIGYEYDLANEQTKITYPNTKTVERGYDKAGRLSSVKDWLEHTTSFAYDPNSNLTAITFPTGTGETDHYAYNEADQQTEAKMSKGEETLASLAYTRDNMGQVTNTANTRLPGPETVESSYDENERLAKDASSTYEYDPANNPTIIPGSSNTFDAANELTEGTGAKYAYDEEGERTKTTPTTGPATTYGYDQAGDLTSVSRPEEGETTKVEDSYGYNGDGLRTSQTINGTTSYLTWDASSALPLLFNDGSNSYVYGPDGMPVEQINNEEEPAYLHHDQQGSTRLLTNSTGTVTGAYTYTPYGGTEAHTGTASTPLGYDGQYTSSDTGLVYLRARVYDPATGQFLSVDPMRSSTGAPYTYAGDNPLTYGDPTGLSFGGFLEEVGEGIAGAGDTLTFGATKWIREELGINNVLSCSTAYQAGGIAGLVAGALIPGEDAAEAARAAEAGATDLGEQLALHEAEAGAGRRIMEGRINDPSYPEDVWAKMQHVHKNPDGSNTVIHYWENMETGIREGFKIK